MAGRPSKAVEWLTDDGLHKIRAWARDGLTDAKIAEKIGVTPHTVQEWKHTFPTFSTALQDGRAVNTEVEDSLESLTRERRVTVKKPIKVRTVKQDGKKKIIEEHIEYADEELYFPPNLGAVSMWLKAHKKEIYNIRPEFAQQTSDDPLMEMLKRWDDAAAAAADTGE